MSYIATVRHSCGLLEGLLAVSGPLWSQTHCSIVHAVVYSHLCDVCVSSYVQ